jgi:hypothetical protein
MAINASVAPAGYAFPERDVDLFLHGSITLIPPLTEAAKSWIAEHIDDEDALYFGDALAVEPRHAPDIIQGMIDDGLAVYVGAGQLTSID